MAEMGMRCLPNSYRQKQQGMEEHAAHIHTLFLGNSHGFYSINPHAFPQPSYNLCNVSQTLDYDSLLLCRALDVCPQLQTVVLIADHSNLFDPPRLQLEPFRATYYHLYMDFPISTLSSPLHAFELSNFDAAKIKFLQWWDGNNSTCDSLGWCHNYTPDKRPLKNLSHEMAVAAARHHGDQTIDNAFTNRQTLFHIARLLQERHITLVLLLTPVTSDYTRTIIDEFPKVDYFVRHTLMQCASRYGAIIADYSTDSNFINEDFFDADHLTTIGGDKFSTLLAEFLDSTAQFVH